MIADPSQPEKPHQRILAIIPARLASTRLPRKVLLPIAGEPMLAWVVKAALGCSQLDQVIVATDAEEVADLCRERGWPFQMTSQELPSGSDRVQAVARLHPADIYINLQADEPMLQPEHVDALLRPFSRPEVQVTSLRLSCPPEDAADPNVVKVVIGEDGRALYFSRAAIPFDRDGSAPRRWKHLGFYAYRRDALESFTRLPVSELERAERLEQLRFLEAGIQLHIETVTRETIGVDTPHDLRRVEAIFATTRHTTP